MGSDGKGNENKETKKQEQDMKNDTVDYLDKFAFVKEEVYLPENIAQIHGHPYRIVNQNEKRTWICLQSKVNIHQHGPGGSEDKVEDKSFWMKVSECNIVDTSKLTYS